MSDKEDAQEIRQPDPEFDFSEFLESHPPNQLVRIKKLAKKEWRSDFQEYKDELLVPQLQLHCGSEVCNGTRFFRFVGKTAPVLNDDKFTFIFVTYRCYNCLSEEKTFSIAAAMDSKFSESGKCYKFGELPNFGPPAPAKLIKLIGPDREEFLKGRRCENQGLGVGAFIYYRRVVENQKDRILNEIIRVSEKIGAPEQKIEILKNAVKETQFSTALKSAKDAIPESLLINGHNPLLLLHGALSEGVHALTDEKCLEIASSVRVVLAELSERLSQALKDEEELKKALGTLMNYKSS